METAQATSQEPWEELQLNEILGKRQHYLGTLPIVNGMELELLLDDGTALLGTYEWSGMTARWPGLRVRLRVRHEPDNGRPVYAVLAVPPQALLRIPVL